MTTTEIAHRLIGLCNQIKFIEAIESLYSADIVSVEATPMPDGTREFRGLAAVKGKSEWWESNHEIHSFVAEGPLVAGNHFCVRFVIDVTFKPQSRRVQMEELGVYQVRDGKIVREEFFYGM